MITPELSIILPCYNESGNIPFIFERFREVLGDRTGVEVVLVNNGSTDDSATVLEAELSKPEHTFARVETVEVNQGYGFGILSGLRAASGEYLAWTHADMQTDPKDVLLGFDKMKSMPEPEKTFLRGRRIGRNPMDAFFTWGMGWVSSVALSTRLRDVNAQPKIFHSSFFESLDNPPYDFSLDLYILFMAQRGGLKVLDIPVDFKRRRHGVSKGGGSFKGKFKLIKRTWSYIFSLRHQLKQDIHDASSTVEP